MKKSILVLISLVCISFTVWGQTKAKLIIDAGHGGTDVGAKLVTGDKESDICLGMANVLAEYAKQNNIEVEMTRTRKDQYLTHQMRSGHKAEKNMKTFFVSLHLDHDNNPNKKGAKILYYSKNAFASTSRLLAERIAKGLERLNNTKPEIVDKEAIVLTKNDMPAVMVYYGFLSNYEDLKRAKDPGYQKELALLIVKTILE